MLRYLSTLLLITSLSGCMGWLEPSTRSSVLDADWPTLPNGPYYFAWRLSGDRAVGPLQVFDNGRDTWLQFLPDQTLPAIFGVRDKMEYLLPYQRRGPYVYVTGVWPQMMLRGGALTARAEYLGNIQEQSIQGRDGPPADEPSRVNHHPPISPKD